MPVIVDRPTPPGGLARGDGPYYTRCDPDDGRLGGRVSPGPLAVHTEPRCRPDSRVGLAVPWAWVSDHAGSVWTFRLAVGDEDLPGVFVRRGREFRPAAVGRRKVPR